MSTTAKKAPVKKPAAKAAPKAAPKADKPEATEAPAVAASAFSFPGLELPEQLIPQDASELAEKSIANARDLYEQAKANAEAQGSAIEKSFEVATESAKALNIQAVEATKANIDAGFSLINSLIGAKSINEALELQSAYFTKQVESASTQSKELQDSVVKSFEEASAPIKEATDKAIASLKIAS